MFKLTKYQLLSNFLYLRISAYLLRYTCYIWVAQLHYCHVIQSITERVLNYLKAPSTGSAANF